MEQRGNLVFWAFSRVIFERIVNVELFEKIHSHCSLDFECVSFCGCFVQLVALSCSLAWLLLSGDGKGMMRDYKHFLWGLKRGGEGEETGVEVPKGRVGKTLRDLPMSPSVGSDNTSWDMLISHKIDPSPLFFGQEIPLVAQVVGFHHRQSRITQKNIHIQN